jgi:hypothetical protein
VLARHTDPHAIGVQNKVYGLAVFDHRREGAAPTVVRSYEVEYEVLVGCFRQETDLGGEQ